ncbi:MAG: polyprenyl synthetase family protein, partial [Planctomycetota bacterium]|nr:polyprenyl synthetase family protein [Planctomycetota bacterium]
QPSPEQYEQIASDKSGVLFALPLELACLDSGHDEFTSRARRAANLFAVGYQIADDIDDAAEDLAKGRLNYVGLLRGEAGDDAALRAARERSLTLLAESVAVSHRLPRDAGAFLAELASKLAAQV